MNRKRLLVNWNKIEAMRYSGKFAFLAAGYTDDSKKRVDRGLKKGPTEDNLDAAHFQNRAGTCVLNLGMLLNHYDKESSEHLSGNPASVGILAKLPIFEDFTGEVKWLSKFDPEIFREFDKLCRERFGAGVNEMAAKGMQMILDHRHLTAMPDPRLTMASRPTIQAVQPSQPEAQRKNKLKWLIIVNSIAWVLVVVFDKTLGDSTFVQIFFGFVLVMLIISIAVGLKIFRGDYW